VLTQLEHHSNLVPWQMIAAQAGAQLRYIPVDAQGVHDLSTLDELLVGARMVALSQVSNTFGTIAPLDVIIPKAHAAGALVLVDGAQSAPHMPVDVQALDCDFFVASGHKLCGPTGIGFLYGRRSVLESMPPFLTGGDMISKVTYDTTTFNVLPWRFEAGTSAFAEAVALAAAIEYLENIGLDVIADHERRLTAYAFGRLDELAGRGLQTYGPRDQTLHSGIISFTFADIHPHDLASLLAADGICVRAGHHCTMPLMDLLHINATARASFYLYNGEDDVDALLTSLHKAARIFGVK
jgi:cysteine desulfurase/selenocysteine lyase